MTNLKSAAVYIISASVIFLSLCASSARLLKYQSAVATPSSGRCVILDAGHGYPDGGAVGVSGVLEKDINLKICQKLRRLLEQSGTHVILTRDDDNSIADGEKIRDIKRADLKARRDFRLLKNADIFVSIHMNKFPDEKYSGAQVFYSRTPQESETLALAIQKSFLQNLDSSNTRSAKKADNSIYILKEAEIPSVIAECGFLSNRKEEALLKTDEYQDKVAWAIFVGINDFFAEET